MSESKLKVMSLFSGAGGTCLAFKKAGFEIVVANEIDKHACITYRANFPNTHLIEGCINEHIDQLKSYNVDVVVAGFPCQSFSVAGNRKGMEDRRGTLINSVFDICRAVQPKAIFLENVKGLLSSNEGKDFYYIKSTLSALGYRFSYEVINAFKSGYTRQIRERLYIVASKNEEFSFKPLKAKGNIRDIDFSLDIPELEYTKEKFPGYFSEKINLSNIEPGKFYQLRRGVLIRELKNCPTLTANMGTGGHNIPLIKTSSGKIRKLSTHECFNLMCFPPEFILPEITNRHLYKQAGNSVIVELVSDIAIDISSLR